MDTFTPKRTLPVNAIEHLAECPCPTCEYYRVYQASPQTPASMWEAFSPYSPQMLLWAQMAAMQQLARSPMSTQLQDPETELKAHMGGIASLACTAEGRALIQSALPLASPDMMECIVNEIMSDFETVAMSEHGSHVVRSLLDSVDENGKTRIVGDISCMPAEVVLNLGTSSQFTRKLLETILSWRHLDLTTIGDVIVANCLYLAVTQHGCLTLNAFVSKCSREHLEDIVRLVSRRVDSLSCDQYGNYFMQTLLQHVDERQSAAMFNECFRGKLCQIAMNKYGSNVVERLSRALTGAARKAMLDEVVFQNPTVNIIVSDPFANFVLQSLLDSAPSVSEHKKICEKIRPFVHRSPYAQKIEAKMKARRNNGSQQQSRGTSPTNAFTPPLVDVSTHA